MAVLKEKTKGRKLLTIQPKPHNYTDTILPSRHFYDFWQAWNVASWYFCSHCQRVQVTLQVSAKRGRQQASSMSIVCDRSRTKWRLLPPLSTLAEWTLDRGWPPLQRSLCWGGEGWEELPLCSWLVADYSSHAWLEDLWQPSQQPWKDVGGVGAAKTLGCWSAPVVAFLGIQVVSCCCSGQTWGRLLFGSGQVILSSVMLASRHSCANPWEIVQQLKGSKQSSCWTTFFFFCLLKIICVNSLTSTLSIGMWMWQYQTRHLGHFPWVRFA